MCHVAAKKEMMPNNFIVFMYNDFFFILTHAFTQKGCLHVICSDFGVAQDTWKGILI